MQPKKKKIQHNTTQNIKHETKQNLDTNNMMLE